MVGVIVCAGSIYDYEYLKKYFDRAELVIGADGGAHHLRRFSIAPHILVGDFDSISAEDYNSLLDAGTEIIKYPPEKDKTDTELAVELAMERGCKEIVLLGAVGTRLDHSLANIYLLKKLLDNGINGIVANETNEISMIKDRIELHKEGDEKVTLLPFTASVEGVTTKGLLYPLHGAALDAGSTLGVSNEFTAETAEVSIMSGLLLVLKSRDHGDREETG